MPEAENDDNTTPLPETPLTAKNHRVAARWVLAFSAPTVFFYRYDLSPDLWPILKYIVVGWPFETTWSLLLHVNIVAYAVFVILASRFFLTFKAEAIMQSASKYVNDFFDSVDQSIESQGNFDPNPAPDWDDHIIIAARTKSNQFIKADTVLRIIFTYGIDIVLPAILGLSAIIVSASMS